MQTITAAPGVKTGSFLCPKGPLLLFKNSYSTAQELPIVLGSLGSGNHLRIGGAPNGQEESSYGLGDTGEIQRPATLAT